MIEAVNLTVSVKSKKLLDGISFSAQKGRITAILGRNGSGKTTLLRTLSGNTKKYSGRVLLDGENLHSLSQKERAKRLSYMPQSLPSPAITTRELISYGRYAYLSPGGVLSKADREAVEGALEITQLSSKSEVAVCHLSGGERQLACFAMLLAQGRQVLLLDEAASGLDTAVKKQFYSIIGKMRDEGKTIVLIIHDLNDALSVADDFYVMDAGKFIFHGDKEDFLSSNIPEKVFGLTKYDSQNEKGEKKTLFHFED